MNNNENNVKMNQLLRKIENVFTIGLPISGAIFALYNHDMEGFMVCLGCAATTSGISHVSKLIFNHTFLGVKPNGKSGAFPAANAASAFSGASFLSTRYGWDYNTTVAYICAAITAYSEVEGERHHVRDVVSGAMIAYAVSYSLNALFPNEGIGR